MADKKWIQKANIKKGALTEQAKKAGKSLSAFMASPGKNPSPQTKKRIALARTFKKMTKKK